MTSLSFNIGNDFIGGGYHMLKNPTTVGRLVSVGYLNAIVIAGVVLVFMIIIAGYQMMSGSGDPQKQQQAQKILTYALIGFIIVVAAYLIVTIIGASTGTSLL